MKQAKPSPTRNRLGPYYKIGRLALIDGRRAEAMFIRKEQARLVEAVGGEATAMQQLLIERASYLRLRIHLMEQETINGTPMSDHDHTRYLRWSSAYSKLLTQITAMTPKPDTGKPPPPTLAELHAEIGKPNAEHR
jgi:hypothetical protein